MQIDLEITIVVIIGMLVLSGVGAIWGWFNGYRNILINWIKLFSGWIGACIALGVIVFLAQKFTTAFLIIVYVFIGLVICVGIRTNRK